MQSNIIDRLESYLSSLESSVRSHTEADTRKAKVVCELEMRNLFHPSHRVMLCGWCTEVV